MADEVNLEGNGDPGTSVSDSTRPGPDQSIDGFLSFLESGRSKKKGVLN